MRELIDRFSRPLIVAVVVIGLGIYGLLDLLPSRTSNTVPDHWTTEYENATWNDFNKNAPGHYDKRSALDAMEAAFPDPRDAERASKASKRDINSSEGQQLQGVATQILRECRAP